jgi:hypothetical protein
MLTNFRSQARVIDLLGREQIADSPTAIGEIFKNALDAAARNVWVDYQDERDLLVIRDDGLGMRYADVTEKWLILATDSSHRGPESNTAWAKFADEEQKIWLQQPRYGEKGIGRLSISILGRFTLLWTVWGKGKAKTGTLCLVHWNLFRHPGKLFEDLPIPCAEFKQPATAGDIAQLLLNLKRSPKIQSLLKDSTWNPVLREELNSDLNQGFNLPKNFKSLPWEIGTSFYIQGLSDHVPELFEKRNRNRKPEEELSPDQLKSFHAFSTFWDPFHSHGEGRDFRIHPSFNGVLLPDINRYWQPDDFTRCDHHIRVEVDENGYASGTLKNYGKRPVEYRKQLKTLPKNHRSPGKFLVEIGYLQGDRSVSKLPADDYSETQSRLEHSGGFSIYLNKVRIQPYGSVDNDFAGFETRRLKNAGRYYFASRRMFGGIFIPSVKETELREKAGREGFIANAARRGLRYWIEDLFVDLADSHYGSNADRPDKKEAKLRKLQAGRTKKRLEEDKRLFLQAVQKARRQQDSIIKKIKEKIQNIESYKNSENNASPGTYLKEMESKIHQLRELAQTVYDTPDTPPAGVVLEGDESTAVEQYRSDRERILRDLNKRILKFSEDLEKASSRLLDYQERVDILKKRIESTHSNLKKGIESLILPIIQQNENIEERIKHIGEEEYEQAVTVFEEALGKITPEAIVSDRTQALSRRLEEAIQKSKEFFEEIIKPRLVDLRNEIEHLLQNTSSAVLAQDFADEVTRLKDRESYLIELAQLGLITETATHEHENHVQKVLESIQSLRKRSKKDDLEIINVLSTSFDIVDARMRMFDPLIRRQGKISDSLSGEIIVDFLQSHFMSDFENGVIEATNSFRQSTVHSIKIPVFLGALYNLVHNALYWCRQGSPKSLIRLSAASGRITVSDSGPGVSPRDSQRIFDPGFSRRPYGRGLGLFIAKEALDGIGYNLFLAPEAQIGALDGANFVIEQQQEDHG